MKSLVLIIAMAISFQGLAQETTTASSDLRERNTEIQWDVSYIETYNEDANELEQEDLKVTFSYLQNWGRFAAGLGIAYTTAYSEDATAVNEDTNSTAFYLLGKLNFVEDVPGNDLIPFVGIAVGTGNAGNASTDVSITATEVTLGLKWYPLGEIFAMNASITPFANIDAEGSKTEVLGAKLGMSLNF